MSDRPLFIGPRQDDTARSAFSAAALNLENSILELNEILHSFSVAVSRRARHGMFPAEQLIETSRLASYRREVGAEASALASVLRAAIDAVDGPPSPPALPAMGDGASESNARVLRPGRLLDEAAEVARHAYGLHERLRDDPASSTVTLNDADALLVSVRAHATNLLLMAAPAAETSADQSPAPPPRPADEASRDQ